ncbi:MAG: DUF2306 domain-containing protein [Saprospiraceae bacterium]
MALEKIIQILIYLHIGFGTIALLSGLLALSSKKGHRLHKKSGKIFYYSMLFSAFISLIIASMPAHQNPFLFAIGIFSAYFILSGYRSLRFKQKEFDTGLDKIIAYTIILTGIGMMLFPILFLGKLNIVLLVFGLISLTFGIRDVNLLRDPENLKRNWLTLHLGKMTGGYIAAVSAFFVVNEILPGIWNWFVPGIVGGFYITYWTRKLNKK